MENSDNELDSEPMISELELMEQLLETRAKIDARLQRIPAYIETQQ
jgi:hypothetical protein